MQWHLDMARCHLVFKFNTIRPLLLVLDLHSLALEDIVKEQGHNHSKADYYQAHLFLRVLCHSLATGNDPTSSAAPLYSSTLGPSRSYVNPENIDTSGNVNNSSTMRRVRNNMKAGLRNPFTNTRQEPRHVFSGLSGVRSPVSFVLGIFRYILDSVWHL